MPMENQKIGPNKVRRLLKLAYHRGNDPKRPLPGPLFDLTVVGLFLFLGIGFLMAAFTDRKQAMHDMIADTLVVSRRP